MNKINVAPNPASAGEPAPAFLKKWLVATRPFALPASTMSVIFGTVLAITIGSAQPDWLLFLLSFLAMAILHTGSNLLNDAFDYRQGIDRQVNPVSGGVVRGWISAREAQVAGLLFLAVGSLIGLYIVSVVGMAIFWIGIIGVCIGILYTWGPAPLKFIALGDWAVFLNFGILGALGAWTVQTGSVSWVPALWAIPMSLLVVAILHANNWRDISSDSATGIRTMASLLGDRASETYYTLLLFSPFALIIVFLIITRLPWFGPAMPLTFLVTLLALPQAIGLNRKGRQRLTADQPMDFLSLDGATAQFNLQFGLLGVAALIIDYYLPF
ncbi:MAG: 1,4-dihydroxy-2-naphthoate octaprenyltransferase [Candidatus Neomarinimicrobiota bacterium]